VAKKCVVAAPGGVGIAGKKRTDDFGYLELLKRIKKRQGISKESHRILTYNYRGSISV
jgi:hypothetical protein